MVTRDAAARSTTSLDQMYTALATERSEGAETRDSTQRLERFESRFEFDNFSNQRFDNERFERLEVETRQARPILPLPRASGSGIPVDV